MRYTEPLRSGSLYRVRSRAPMISDRMISTLIGALGWGVLAAGLLLIIDVFIPSPTHPVSFGIAVGLGYVIGLTAFRPSPVGMHFHDDAPIGSRWHVSYCVDQNEHDK